MNRASHTTTSAVTHMAMLSIWTHATNRTIPIQASQKHGCTISHALPTQALPSMSGDEVNKELDELLTELDKVIDEIDRINEQIRLAIEALEVDDE